MTTEHWQSFQKQQSFKIDSTMPIDAALLEKQRRKQSGLCSAKSIFCCLSVLLGQSSTRPKNSNKRRQSVEVLRKDDDDGSFGYNFDEMSPRVSTRLASSGHNFD
mmetsp:Transcript_3639/g.9255  ORF Transcript_3639/g.9255 Transcript_3639/m.9255 type:complete len:105 (+) Transcript_3639:373-687(+)|eukprot:CAMPEP_0181108768 /NCGR_PEP_ID=MMETSP1071-20121207/17809_1 /TAXON_ID=35127 /ORGANISM="Thalassiosira sp., Strain NH16" /LENGTH=104 /DNA_ID=CAMNT_0023192399 /DNA_START=347 /DNA_END=661 /DNA_ORIENTATION=-